MTTLTIIAVAAIGVFFAQVLPSIAGEGVRAWLLIWFGCDWQNSVISVVTRYSTRDANASRRRINS
jgi:hypothetical protein